MLAASVHSAAVATPQIAGVTARGAAPPRGAPRPPRPATRAALRRASRIAGRRTWRRRGVRAPQPGRWECVCSRYRAISRAGERVCPRFVSGRPERVVCKCPALLARLCPAGAGGARFVVRADRGRAGGAGARGHSQGHPGHMAGPHLGPPDRRALGARPAQWVMRGEGGGGESGVRNQISNPGRGPGCAAGRRAPRRAGPVPAAGGGLPGSVAPGRPPPHADAGRRLPAAHMQRLTVAVPWRRRRPVSLCASPSPHPW